MLPDTTRPEVRLAAPSRRPPALAGGRRPRPLLGRGGHELGGDRGVALVVALARRQIGERRKHRADDRRRREGRLDLAAVLADEERQVQRLRHALGRRPAVLGEGDGRLEELLHLERRADLDADLGGLVTRVLERVDLAGRHRDDVAGAGDDLLQAHAEGHRALDDLEALLLLGVDVRAGHGAVGGELEFDLDQLAVGVRSSLDEGDLLAADGVLEGLSCVSHFGSPGEVWGAFAAVRASYGPGALASSAWLTVLRPP